MLVFFQNTLVIPMVTVLAVRYLASEVLKGKEKKGKEFVRRCL